MSDLGSNLSKLFGDYKTIEVTAQQTVDGNIHSLEHYRSPTYNSYGKCIDSLASKFPVEIKELARKTIEPHDQNDFDESVDLGDVYKYNEDTGKKYLAGKNVLRLIGKYQFKIFAHCKTMEMWLEFQKIK